MSSYRFCRSDDVPLLVQAYNECYRVHFPDLPPMEVEDFKRQIRELNLWTSSCMVALSGKRPIGVLLAAKREDENLVHRVGIHGEHQRQGHGRHLMASLGAKMSILGPRRMLAEVPAGKTAARGFVEACGYRPERSFTDFSAAPLPAAPRSEELLIPVSLDDLLDNEVLDLGARPCWERSPATLTNRKDDLRGLAVASDERIEAYLLYHDPARGDAREILAFGSAQRERSAAWMELLFRASRRAAPGPVRIARVDPAEISFDLLQRWDFEPQDQTVLYSAQAAPG